MAAKLHIQTVTLSRIEGNGLRHSMLAAISLSGRFRSFVSKP
jgi:hypothetical protein